ncbi:RtcB family protein [Candidatus Uhrbacteria bacterium]|nr:RtcB family protein [Candidatus Uhrbacteria bacterium]
MIPRPVFKKIHDWLWEIPKSFRADMRVPACVYATEHMLDDIRRDRSMDQLINVATLPGIQQYALAMPDAHEGYGFPIGGVAAMDASEGVISPGGIGYDVNCGVRLLRSTKTIDQVREKTDALASALYRDVPSGVGRGGRLILRGNDLDAVLQHGAHRMVELGYGEKADLEHLESTGRLEDADPSLVSDTAKKRGADQLGTMGAGNHFVEVQYVETVFDTAAAAQLGLFARQVVVMIHTGSRGLGHQIATDYIRLMMKVMPKYGITLPDRELACAPFSSPEGQQYFHAMAAGANFAWANRQLITWEVRKSWQEVMGNTGGGLSVIYDVAHNLGKLEDHIISGEKRRMIVHRKGATRAFPDQPVLIPGSMGTASYVLLGLPQAMEQTFGSSCHGAGRRMSRSQAKREVRGSELKQEMKAQGIAVASGSLSGLAEEAPVAYKDVDEVVDVVHAAGIAKKVACMRPIAVIKG